MHGNQKPALYWVVKTVSPMYKVTDVRNHFCFGKGLNIKLFEMRQKAVSDNNRTGRVSTKSCTYKPFLLDLGSGVQQPNPD